jgi:hypothetical protein
MSAEFSPQLNLDQLSRAHCDGRALLREDYRDVLAMWPHEYASNEHEYELQNQRWTAGMDWSGIPGYKHGPLRDCALEPFAFNYGFDALFDFIPSRGDGHMLYFDVRNSRDHEAKCRNYYAAQKYICQYPRATKELDTCLGMSVGTFYQQVVPGIFRMARSVNFLDANLRFWEYNHCEHFPERVTCSCDGYPVKVCCPENRFLQRLLKSGKYTDFVVKGEYVVSVASGFPTEYVGPHIAIRHDSKMHMLNWRRRAYIFPWEYWLGDKAYVGCPEFLTEIKGKNLPLSQIEYNLTVQHYRGRNEHLISEMKSARNTLSTQWRGSFSLLAAIMKLAAHFVGLQERMRGPRYDCFGPWPMCPKHVANLPCGHSMSEGRADGGG